MKTLQDVKREQDSHVTNPPKTNQGERKLLLRNITGSTPKPPLGLCPKDIWERNNNVDRLNEVRGVIARHYDAGLKIRTEWIEEYNELIEFVLGIDGD
jgi:hypothetical protein